MAGWQLGLNPNINPIVREAANRGLALSAEHILGVSNQDVPIEEATLERSGTVSTDPANNRAAVSYDTPYAVRQHEELGYRHDAGRSAKYLENAFNSQIPAVQQIILGAIKGVF